MFNTQLLSTVEYEKLLGAANGVQSPAALFGLPTAGRAQLAALLAQSTGRNVVAICKDEQTAGRFCEDAAQFGAQAALFPSRDYTLRNIEGQSREFEYRRINVLGSIVGGRVNVVAASLEGALQFTAPLQEFTQNTLTLKQGGRINQQALIQALLNAGYLRRDRVDGPAQFSVRGGIVDIYPPDLATPARIDFFGDDIDAINGFDMLTQRRDLPLKKLHISPAREVLFASPEQTAAQLETWLHEYKGAGTKKFEAIVNHDLQLLNSGVMPLNMDRYLALRYKKPGTLLEYFEKPILLFDEPSALKEAAKALEWRTGQDIETLLEQGVLAPGLTEMYESYPQLLVQAERQPCILCENFARTIGDFKAAQLINVNAHTLPPWNGVVSALLEDVRPLIKSGYAVTVMAGTPRAAKALVRDLEADGLTARFTQTGESAQGVVTVAEGSLTGGVEYPFAKFAMFTSRRQAFVAVRKTARKNKGLTNLEDIKPGDYVVHQNHGIGIYAGIERLDIQGIVKDYLKIKYDGADTLFLPVTQLDALSSYTAPGDSTNVRVARLGGGEWAKTKARTRKATQEMAKELIELYAKRQTAEGYAFEADSDWQRDFETRFEYDETDDQLTSVEEIKADMQRGVPMDRLLCGDVGVGKTEVALRAAFKCILSGKQCAILVPTTILAWQHYNTLQSRMQAFAVNTGLLSRFRTARQQRETVKGLADGAVDIVVGTHRLLQNDIKFKDLGLIIVDEEQRFGVAHKERLKKTFPGVDVLTLSATPIPRTLNMAMSGIRDMSTIEEPPFDRQPVETYVLEYDANVIAQAISKELARGGQVYYLHNRIDTIDRCAEQLRTMCPGARIGVAHGRMDEEALSNVWQQLLNADIDILICTTLIETGVDVKNCNTLIVENADRMGLAQLYQIRGRVGRSGRKAYAYFTFIKDKVLTDIAAKRLSAIREFTTFGSGFRIAMRDLQIRGAGNLLGKTQHGHIDAVGYDLYVKMLAQAVAEQRGEKPPKDKSDCLIDITVDAYLPESYVPDTSGRIEAYKRIAAISSEADAADATDELKDRYGRLPPSAKGLIDISLIRVTAAQLRFYEIVQRGQMLRFYNDAIGVEDMKKALFELKKRVVADGGRKPYIGVPLQSGELPVQLLTQCIDKFNYFFGANKAGAQGV